MRRVCDHYRQIVTECQVVIASDLSDETKKAEALAILHDHVGRIALSRFGSDNIQLRFYLDMLVLRQRLFPHGHSDDLSTLAIWPMFRWVDEWIRAHPT
jgi:hypothetical protein